jgi:hypothetical protein
LSVEAAKVEELKKKNDTMHFILLELRKFTEALIAAKTGR